MTTAERIEMKLELALVLGANLVGTHEELNKWASLSKNENKMDSVIFNKLHALGLTAPCARCLGSGQHSFCPTMGRVCFKCNGSKYEQPKLNKTLIKKVKDSLVS